MLTNYSKYKLLFRTSTTMLPLYLQLHPLLHRLEHHHHQHRLLRNTSLLRQQDISSVPYVATR